MLEAAGMQLFLTAVMIALIMASAAIALTIARLLTPVVLLRGMITAMLLLYAIPLSSKAPKSEMKIQSSAARAQAMQSGKPAPDIKQAGPAYERKAHDTQKMGRQIREDFENLPDAEVPPLSR
ncbi:hypothetical protein [Paracoccus sp. ME4]|uniref:hypothetical protein n=1 Tax=Paracoccus sp. ME4 TaxID=3138066 RepID=UPI00398A5A09